MQFFPFSREYRLPFVASVTLHFTVLVLLPTLLGMLHSKEEPPRVLKVKLLPLRQKTVQVSTLARFQEIPPIEWRYLSDKNRTVERETRMRNRNAGRPVRYLCRKNR